MSIMSFLSELARTFQPLRPKLSETDIATLKKYNLLRHRFPFPILEVPTSKFVDHIAIPYCSPDHYHNRVLAEDGDWAGYSLADYFSDFAPQTMAEALKLSDFPVELAQMEPNSVLNGLPWSSNIRFNQTHRPITQSCAHFGPNLDGFTQEDENRLAAARNHILSGYKPMRYPDGFVRGYVIENENDYCFLVTAGKHRAATVAGTLTKALVRIEWNNFMPVVSRSLASSFPQVKSGVYSEKTAEFLTDLYIGRTGAA